jgi:ankyrin repeat protein
MCQLEALEKCRRPSQLQRALESLPETLNDTYAQTLSRISEEDYEIAVRIFHWLLFSIRPLRIEELAELAAPDFDRDPPVMERFWEPDEILKICPSLLTTLEEHNESNENEPRILVRLAHISVREYLLSHDIRRGQAARYHIEEGAAHTSIAEYSLLYLRLFDMPLSDREKEFTLAIYTAENWLYHYGKVPEGAQKVHNLALDFFLKRKKAYANWLSFFCALSPPKFHPDLLDFVSDSPLNVVATYGLVPILKRMFTSSEIDTSSESVLKRALRSAYLGHPPHYTFETIKLLLQHGADFSGDPKFSDMLHAASYFGFDDVVKAQLEEGFDVNTVGGTFGTALQAAVQGRHDRQFYNKSGLSWPTTGERRPNGFLEYLAPTTVKLLLEKGADPNVYGGLGSSPLLTSCYNGDIPCVKLLLEYGADPNFGAEGWSGYFNFRHSCLSAACYSRDIRIVKLLLDGGASIRSPGALSAATFIGDLDMMLLFLEVGVDPNVVDKGRKEPPLEMACFDSRPEAVKLLLEYGANPNIGGGRFETPLQTAAAAYGSVETLKLLIGKGADVNQIAGAFGTALHAAAFYGDLEMVQCLIDNGADINLEGRLFHSVLRAALQNGHTDIFILLLKLGADLAIPGGQYGETLRETLALAPPTKTELNFRLGSGNYLCVLRRNGASFLDFDNLVLEDRGEQYGAAAAEIEWDCVLPKY